MCNGMGNWMEELKIVISGQEENAKANKESGSRGGVVGLVFIFIVVPVVNCRWNNFGYLSAIGKVTGRNVKSISAFVLLCHIGCI